MAKKATKPKAKKKSGGAKKAAGGKTVETLTHDGDKRKNIPTAEFQSVVAREHAQPVKVKYPRNTDLDPQLVWRGKDEQDWSDLVVHAPPLYIQEKVHPKVLIDDLLRQTQAAREAAEKAAGKLEQLDLFADFNGVPEGDAKTEFYQHDQNWSNRMILGDSLQVMASLAEREGLRGRVQCIYIDPPYGIKFNSNFQWSTTSRDVKDGNAGHITREPEQVKAFRDTWRDGIHSYLTYLRDRLTVARDLLTDSGSIFVQIGDENVHRIRALMDEVFGEANAVSEMIVEKTAGASMEYIDSVADFVLWYAKDSTTTKYRPLFYDKKQGRTGLSLYKFIQDADTFRRMLTSEEKDNVSNLTAQNIFTVDALTSQTQASTTRYRAQFRGREFDSGVRQWATPPAGLLRLVKAQRVELRASSIGYVRFYNDYPVIPLRNIWSDTGTGSFTDSKVYVVQTGTKIVERCILMATDPGDLVLDPTCGSGTTATVAEQWGRRWITIDTSRVALALARARIMGARYPYYLLADSKEGQQKEAEVTQAAPSTQPTHGNIRHGFVYERVPHITLKSIANNAEIDVIWENWQPKLSALSEQLSAKTGRKKPFEEWEIPREADENWSAEAKRLHGQWWEARISRQKEIDASIAAKAEFEYLYDKPYEDKKKVRVAGPFTVESLSPHRMLGVDENDDLIDPLKNGAAAAKDGGPDAFAQMILENLKTAGVQQAHKEDRISFTSLVPWPGQMVCAEGKYLEGDTERRAAIFIGPEFGTVQRQDLVQAAREAGDANFDVLIACAFNYEAHATEFNKLGRIPVLKARINADLHMAEDLKNTGKGNLFVIFGEPDIGIYEGDSLELAAETKQVKHQQATLEKDRGQLAEQREALEAELKKLKKQKGDDGAEAAERLAQELGACERRLDEVDRGLRRCGTFLESTAEIPDGQIVVVVFGVDVFHPNTGEVRSDGADGIACWFVDTDYNDESFFVRHAYFLGASDPYKSLKTTLKAEINEEAWATLYSNASRPFDKPKSGKIAVKVINHLGDEVMKVFRV